MAIDIFWLSILFVLAVEVFSWGVRLNSHSKFLMDANQEHFLKRRVFPESDECRDAEWSIVHTASVMAIGYSMTVFVWISLSFLVISSGGLLSYENGHLVVFASEIALIHWFVSVSRISCLCEKKWPLLSRCKSYLVKRLSRW